MCRLSFSPRLGFSARPRRPSGRLGRSTADPDVAARLAAAALGFRGSTSGRPTRPSCPGLRLGVAARRPTRRPSRRIAEGLQRLDAVGDTPAPRGAVMPAGRFDAAKIAASTCVVLAPGNASNRRAASPATCGVAIDEPERSSVLPPGTHDRTSTPGATRSGRTARRGRGIAGSTRSQPRRPTRPTRRRRAPRRSCPATGSCRAPRCPRRRPAGYCGSDDARHREERPSNPRSPSDMLISRTLNPTAQFSPASTRAITLPPSMTSAAGEARPGATPNSTFLNVRPGDRAGGVRAVLVAVARPRPGDGPAEHVELGELRHRALQRGVRPLDARVEVAHEHALAGQALLAELGDLHRVRAPRSARRRARPGRWRPAGSG